MGALWVDMGKWEVQTVRVGGAGPAVEPADRKGAPWHLLAVVGGDGAFPIIYVWARPRQKADGNAAQR